MPLWSHYILWALRRLQAHWAVDPLQLNFGLKETRDRLSKRLEKMLPDYGVAATTIATWHTKNEHRRHRPKDEIFLAIAQILAEEHVADEYFLSAFLQHADFTEKQIQEFLSKHSQEQPATPQPKVEIFRVVQNYTSRFIYEHVRQRIASAQRSVFVLNYHLDELEADSNLKKMQTEQLSERWTAALELLSIIGYYNDLVVKATRPGRAQIRYRRLIQIAENPDTTDPSDTWESMGVAYHWHLSQMAQIAAKQRLGDSPATVFLKKTPPFLDATFVIIDEHILILQISTIHGATNKFTGYHKLYVVIIVEDNDMDSLPKQFTHLFHQFNPVDDDSNVISPSTASTNYFYKSIGVELNRLVCNTIAQSDHKQQIDTWTKNVTLVIKGLNDIEDAHTTLHQLKSEIQQNRQLSQIFEASYIPREPYLKKWWNRAR